MYLQRVQNIVRGHVYVFIEGFYIEKVINVCKRENINLINVKRASNTLIYASIPVSEFKNVAKIVKKNRCRIKIKQKKGLPFFIKKYRKRKIFAIALILLVICIFSLSKFVWNIEIYGNNRIPSEEIFEIICAEGLETGKLKSKIDLKNIVEKIRMNRADISWVGIKVSGTNVKIEIVEADLAPNIIDKNDYCNIVATKDATIHKVNAQNGTIMVNEGDEIKKGTVLIAGWLEGKYTGTRYVHSTGEVFGKVLYTERSKVCYKQQKKVQTGKEEKKYSVSINNFAINFYKKLSKFEIYDTIRTEKKLKLSSNFYLPFKIVENTNYESQVIENNYTKEEAKEQAVNDAKRKLEDKIANNKGIVNEYITTNENEEYIEVEVTYEVLESIGTEEKIAL